MNFNIYNSIILAGVIQGLIFGALVLFSKKYNSKSVFFLSLLIIVYSFSNLQFYFQDIGLYSYETLFRTLYFPWTELEPALLYFYVLFYLYPEKKIAKKEYLLFLPFALTCTLSLLYKILVCFENPSQFLLEFTQNIRAYVAYYTELVTALLYILVISVIFKKISTYQKLNKGFQLKQISLQIIWLKRTLYILLVLIVIWVSSVVLDNYTEDVSFYPIWIGVAFLIYWLGHLGIYKFGIDEQRKQIRSKVKIAAHTFSETKPKHLVIERLQKYLIEEKQYLDSNLTLDKTAESLGISRGHLSKIINTELGMSFKDYINSLRVEEAKTYLKDSEFSNYTLVAIGLEAGFNSKSTFNASFKKITGETPSQFKQRHII